MFSVVSKIRVIKRLLDNWIVDYYRRRFIFSVSVAPEVFFRKNCRVANPEGELVGNFN